MFDSIGVYAVEISNEEYSITSQCVDMIGLTIPNASNNKLKIYPNPVSNVLHIDTEMIVTFEIFDSRGKLIHSGIKKDIDTKSFATGEYFIVVYTENGNVLTLEKFIKK